MIVSAGMTPMRTEVLCITASACREGDWPDEVVGRHSKAIAPPFPDGGMR